MPTIATQLALHYLPKTRDRTDPLKYVVFLGFLGMSDLTVGTQLVASLLTTMFTKSVVDCASRSRDLRHLPARVNRLREVGTTNSHAQRDPHRDGPMYMSPRYATHLFPSHFTMT